MHHRLHALALHHATIGQARDRRQGVVGAVQHQLGPECSGHVVGDLHRHGGCRKQRCQRVAVGGGSDHQITAPVVLHMARAGHLCGDVDHGRCDLALQQRLQALGVVDAVLQAEHLCIVHEVRSDFCTRSFGVAGLHAHQHQRRPRDDSGFGTRLHRQMRLERRGVQKQAIATHCLHMRGAPDQAHRVAGACQHAAVVAAHCAGAHHGDLHGRASQRSCSVMPTSIAATKPSAATEPDPAATIAGPGQ